MLLKINEFLTDFVSLGQFYVNYFFFYKHSIVEGYSIIYKNITYRMVIGLSTESFTINKVA